MNSRLLATQFAVGRTCPRFIVRTITVCVVVSSFSSSIAGGETPPNSRYGVKASGKLTARTGYLRPTKIENPPLKLEPPVLTDEQKAAVAQCQNDARLRSPVRKDPNAGPEDYQRVGVETALPLNPTGDGAVASTAGGLFQVWRNSSVAGVQTAGETVFPEEPTVGMNRDLVFYAGNAYAAISGDGGITWSYINPFDNFPADGINDVPTNSGGFCCDQVVYYEPTRDCMFWLLQYATPRDGLNNRIIGNVQRLAASCGRENLLANQWPVVIDFSAPVFGFAPSSFWLDFPDLAVSDRFLYYTTNVAALSATTVNASVITRIPLDYLRTGVGGFFQYYEFDDQTSLRCVHGAADFMYWGAHEDNNTLRIYYWWDHSNDIGFDDVDHPAFEDDDFRAFGPDGTNFAAFSDSRILTAYRANGELGFLYNCSQKNSPFPFPYVDVGKYRETDREYSTTEPIFNLNTAMIYPSVHPNNYGAKGGTIAYGGGALHPGFYAFIVDTYNNNSFSPLEVVGVASGTAGPSTNRWGDYLSTRLHWSSPETWIGTGYVMNGPANNNADPRFVWFGRLQDEPGPDFDVNGVTVNPLTPPYSVGGPLPVQINAANAGATDAHVPNLDIRLSTDNSIDGTDVLYQSLPVNLDPGEIKTISVSMPIPDVPAGDYFVGVWTPFYVDDYVGNNSAVFTTPVRICPGFLEHPVTRLADACGQTSFRARLTGDRPRQFQWQKDGVNLFDDKDNIFGAQTDTLTIRAVFPNDAGNYSVLVSEGPCTVTSNIATLFVRPPQATSIAGSGTFEVCTDTVLDANIHGVPEFFFQWYKNGDPLADDGRISGSRGEDLSLPSLELDDSGRYTLNVANYCDSSLSQPVDLNVLPKPWTQVASTGPSYRVGPSMAYDSRRGVTVMFGGQYPDLSAVTRETWEWNGNTWALRATTGPPALSGAGMAFDEDRGKCVLFGGWAGGSGSDPSRYRSETWEWDGTSWTQIITSGPTERSSPGFVYDTVAKKIVLHGGTGVPPGGGLEALHDTWEYDGIAGTWTQISSGLPALPPGNYADVGTMAYDKARNKRFVFNAYIVAGDFTNWGLHTFEWDGAQWVRIFPGNDPVYNNPGMYTGGAGIAYHEGRQKIIWNNGAYRFTDPVQVTWSFDGTAWKLLSLSDGPPRSAGGSIVYDRARNAIVQFGGIGPFGFSPPNTWELVDADRVEIVRQPAQRTVVNGQPVQFAVIVKGAPTYSFQWRRNGQILNDGDGVLGANTGILRINAVTLTHAGQYDVVITNDCGSVTSAVASLTVIATRFGDGDGDTDVDLDDAALLTGCQTGPGGSRAPGCEPFDFDGDGDIDLQDMAQFQLVFGT